MATVRRYRTADDAAALTQFLHASRLRGELPDIAERDVAWFVDYAATVAEESAVAADDDGTMIGMQGRGLGRELLRWGVDRLRSLDVPLLFLTVDVTNERALGLCEQHGFRRTREKPRWALPVGA